MMMLFLVGRRIAMKEASALCGGREPNEGDSDRHIPFGWLGRLCRVMVPRY